MANTKQAAKRARQAEKHRQNNRWQKTRLSSTLKKVVSAIEAGNKEVAQTGYTQVVALLDKAANKGIIHKNKAARHKSRLNAHIKAMA